MVRRILFSIHRVLGTSLSILFLVWFLSGFVMIFHGFPRVSIYDKARMADPLPAMLPPLDSVLGMAGVEGSISKLELRTYYGEQLFTITTIDSVYRLTAEGAIIPDKPSYGEVEAYAKRWCAADIKRVDTLYDLDQWIPFNRLRNDFPIYKVHFADSDAHQLYLSSRTGEALQFTNKGSRFWALLGAIPHWVYFTSLRQDAQLWSTVVVWLSGIGSIMCLAGLVAGVWVYVRRYRAKKKFRTPYRKFAYKWHHMLGFVFGIFTFTFVFSGMMSLARVPDWIAKTHKPQQTVMRDMHRAAVSVQPASYTLDYRELMAAYPNAVKSIEWSKFGSIASYRVMLTDSLCVLDASDTTVQLLALTPEVVQQRFEQEYGTTASVELMTEYDSYYLSRKHSLPLPVYKVELSDADKSVYYLNPKTGDSRFYNRKGRVQKWVYQGLHSFSIKFLVDRPVLWHVVMWTTMLGGTAVSATGVWLGYKWVRRKLKWLRRRVKKI